MRLLMAANTPRLNEFPKKRLLGLSENHVREGLDHRFVGLRRQG
jgi:hypothetical protein